MALTKPLFLENDSMASEILTQDLARSIAEYDAMCRQIAECESAAECKDIFDKAAALKEYARRMHNLDAEHRAANIRIIAERRYGELLKEMERSSLSKGGDTRAAGNLGAPVSSPYAQALADTGVSRRAASRYQALADVPQEIFDAALNNPDAIPIARTVVQKAREIVSTVRNPPFRIDLKALAFWGYARDFERKEFADQDTLETFSKMTNTMQADMLRLVPVIAKFFNQLEKKYESARRNKDGHSDGAT
jgi:hypothetical protein